MLPPGVMLMWVTYAAIQGQGDVQIYVAAKGHVWDQGPPVAGVSVGVCGPCYHRIEKTTFAVILMTADAKFRRGDMEGFCDNP